jgi:hypothetical protein
MEDAYRGMWKIWCTQQAAQASGSILAASQ